MHRILIIVFILFSAVVGPAQDIAQEIEALRAAYAEENDKTFEVRYSTFIASLDSIELDVQEGKVIKQGEYQYNQVGGLHFYQTPSYSFTVNKEESFLAFFRKEGDAEIPPQAFQGDIAALLKQCETYDIKSLKRGMMQLTLKPQTDQFEKIEIVYKEKDHTINTIYLYYKNAMPYQHEGESQTGKPILCIEMSQYRKDPGYATSFFSVDQYMTIRNGKRVLKPAYAHYKLIGDTTVK